MLIGEVVNVQVPKQIPNGQDIAAVLDEMGGARDDALEHPTRGDRGVPVGP